MKLIPKFFFLGLVMTASTPWIVTDASARTTDARVTVVGDTITIRTEIVIYGPRATTAEARAIRENILDYWEFDSFRKPWTYLEPRKGRRYFVRFDVDVSLYNGLEKQNPRFIVDAWNPMSRKNYIRLSDAYVRSHVTGGDTGVWYQSESMVYAHEFGHLLGLKDRYHDGKDGYSIAESGWENNLMAAPGIVEQRNIDAIARQIFLGRLWVGGDFKVEIDNNINWY